MALEGKGELQLTTDLLKKKYISLILCSLAVYD